MQREYYISSLPQKHKTLCDPEGKGEAPEALEGPETGDAEDARSPGAHRHGLVWGERSGVGGVGLPGRATARAAELISFIPNFHA